MPEVHENGTFTCVKMVTSANKIKVKGKQGTNPTIVSYNANAAKIYNAASSPVRFENKNMFFFIEKTL
jgi:hypothetical protein